MIVNLSKANIISVSLLSLVACDDTDGIIDGFITNPSQILKKRGNLVGQAKEVQGLVDNVRS